MHLDLPSKDYDSSIDGDAVVDAGEHFRDDASKLSRPEVMSSKMEQFMRRFVALCLQRYKS